LSFSQYFNLNYPGGFVKLAKRWCVKVKGVKSLMKRLLVVVLVVLALLWGRVLWLQRAHFLEAEGYLQEANYKLAIREYDTALHFYSPFSPYNERAAQRLWQIGERFEAQGKLDWAHMAYSSIRSSFYAARSFYTPGKAWIARCDEKIATLNARMLLQDGSIGPEEFETERARHLRVLRQDRAPSVPWAALAVLSFLGWVGSAVYVALRGFSPRGDLHRRQALWGLLGFVAFFLLWVVGLLRA